MDLRRLARVRKAIRDVLPKKGAAAVSLLRQRLSKEDGDSDGVISDIELMRGLTVLNPGLTSSDVGFIVKYLHSKAARGDEAGSSAAAAAAAANSTGGLAPGIDLGAVADFITRQPGGYEARYGKDAEQLEEAPAPAPEDARLAWNSRAQKFLAFRAGWEASHGAAARKELANDAKEGAEGPTWTRAEPQPFRVVHLAAAAPPPPGAATTT